jgi:3-hydroxyisobutyrate dehydrogenase
MHIAVLGIGLLGQAVVERLNATGHTVTAHNRTTAKTEPLKALGVQMAESASEAIGGADCTLLFLSDADAIRAVVFNPGARASLKGRTIIQMGTIGPQESREFHQAVTESGGDYFEAPVLGSIAEAKAGTLLVMVGGTQGQLQRWEPVFRSLSRKPRLVGPVGQAASLKLALNQLIAAEIIGFALSLGLVQRAGISVDLFMSVLKDSALFAPAFEKKLPRLQQRQYDHPNFATSHLLKDVELFRAAAMENGLVTRALDGTCDILKGAMAKGLGPVDYSAVYEEIDPQPSA